MSSSASRTIIRLCLTLTLMCWGGLVAEAAPNAPTLISPANNSNVPGKSSIEFYWQFMPMADRMEFQISLDPPFSIWVNASFSNIYSSVLVGPHMDNGTVLYWRMRAHDVSGWGNWSQTWRVTNGPGQLPDVPVLDLPINNSGQAGATVLFLWETDVIPRGASRYSFSVARDSAFTNFPQEITFNALNVTTGQHMNSMVMSNLPDNGQILFWKVRSWNALGWSNWSPTRSVTNGPSAPPATPTLSSPANQANAAGDQVILWWNPTPRAYQYRFQLAWDSGFNDMAVDIQFPSSITKCNTWRS